MEAAGEEGEEQFKPLTARLRVAAENALPVVKTSVPASPEAATAQPVPVAVRDPGAPEILRTEPIKADDDISSSAVADSNIRVGVSLLDKLMDLVGELVLTRNQILQFNAEREDPALNATSQRLNLITSELQEGVMKTRMQPIGMVWNKLPRVVRDMAVALGKQIRLDMEGPRRNSTGRSSRP
jgi:two-component system chemotaxis sensor kinase CheA